MSHLAARLSPAGLLSGSITQFVSDANYFLGVPAGQKAMPEWQAANTDPKPVAQMQADHPGFMATCRLVRTWLLG